jgi:hypothetical protein
MTIDAYLGELRDRLPNTRRRRVLHEVGPHLRDAAAALEHGGLAPDVAEAKAVAAFGPADVVAEEIAREVAPIAVRRAAVLVMVGLGVLVVPLYGIPQNFLPPAPWDERSAHLGALLLATFAAWALSLGLAVSAAAVSLASRPRLAVGVLGIAAVAGLASIGAAVATIVVWWLEVPHVPIGSLVAFSVPATLVAAAIVLAGVGWARDKRPLLT